MNKDVIVTELVSSSFERQFINMSKNSKSKLIESILLLPSPNKQHSKKFPPKNVLFIEQDDKINDLNNNNNKNNLQNDLFQNNQEFKLGNEEKNEKQEEAKNLEGKQESQEAQQASEVSDKKTKIEKIEKNEGLQTIELNGKEEKKVELLNKSIFN